MNIIRYLKNLFSIKMHSKCTWVIKTTAGKSLIVYYFYLWSNNMNTAVCPSVHNFLKVRPDSLTAFVQTAVHVQYVHRVYNLVHLGPNSFNNPKSTKYNNMQYNVPAGVSFAKSNEFTTSQLMFKIWISFERRRLYSQLV